MVMEGALLIILVAAVAVLVPLVEMALLLARILAGWVELAHQVQ